MSDPLALAAVTATVRAVLQQRFDEPTPGLPVGVRITTAHPAGLHGAGRDGEPLLDLYCYALTPATTAVRSAPPRPAAPARGPVSATTVDAHYLLSCPVDGRDVQAELLLGVAAVALADHAVLTPGAVAGALAGDPALRHVVDTTSLLAAVAGVRVVPEAVSLDETARLWQALQARYRPALTYRAGPVLLDA